MFIFELKKINSIIYSYKKTDGDLMQWDAVVNAILSFFIPGLGQGINGYKQKGIILFVIFIALSVLTRFAGLGIAGTIILILLRLYAAYDAYNTY